MKLYKTPTLFILEKDNSFYQLPHTDWDTLVNRDDLFQFLKSESEQISPITDPDFLAKQTILAPIGTQEVWASGVTYMKSKTARMEEAEQSGGGSFYDKVYDAERPELFFKATPNRVVGTGGKVRIRKDSTWNVPEPELTLFITSSGKIVGYTAGNDMSSRSIEGENPLYLPQAKTYDGAAALGPCLYIPESPIASDAKIMLQISRNGQVMFLGDIEINQMKRSHTELVGFLFRECSFATGCFLMTGTGLVPPNEFTLLSNDEIKIEIEHIGVLTNLVA